ncbi:MAG: DNA topoisomerase, partial [Candidatus Diapherotrites archaeon]
SSGRVQTPVLRLIVDREKERRAFKPEKYWELKALLEKDRQKFEAMHKTGRFKSEEEAKKAQEAAEKTDKAIVKNVKSTKRKIAKPVPFNTTEFLRAATAIGMTAGDAMNTAESLYQMGLTSYPRTDNTVYPINLNLQEILSELLNSPELSKDVQKVLALGKIEPSHGKETKDHPPIHPVSVPKKGQLNPKQWKVYELIARRFLATLSEDAETLNLSVDFDINGEPFLANGQAITKKGWKEVYPYSALKETLLPKLNEGDIAKLLNLDLLGKETQPPPRYSQGALIKLMESRGLGTKSTRHEILQKLLARHYIFGTKAIEPNEIAFAVVDSLDKYCERITKPEMTAETENEMDLIAAGKRQKEDVVSGSRKLLSELLEDLLKNKNEIGSELRKALRADKVIGKCDLCAGNLVIRKGRSGKRFLGCSNYPKCTNTFPLPQKGSVSPGSALCKTCGKATVKVVGGRYRYEMCVDMNCKSKDEWKKKNNYKNSNNGKDAETPAEPKAENAEKAEKK